MKNKERRSSEEKLQDVIVNTDINTLVLKAVADVVNLLSWHVFGVSAIDVLNERNAITNIRKKKKRNVGSGVKFKTGKRKS